MCATVTFLSTDSTSGNCAGPEYIISLNFEATNFDVIVVVVVVVIIVVVVVVVVVDRVVVVVLVVLFVVVVVEVVCYIRMRADTVRR